jgi:hypothetical protein
MANAAVMAVKKGCQLYKDVKSAAGNVQEILDDLHSQFAGKKLTKVQVTQYEKEKERVKEIAKADPSMVLGELGQHLGTFFDTVDQVEALFYAEEKKSKEVYRGEESASRRALQRVMVRTKLESLQVELREMMIYQTPPELGNIWTRFEAMRAQIGVEQVAARKEEERLATIAKHKRNLLVDKWQNRILYFVVIFIMALEIWGLLITIAMTRRSSLSW